MTASFRGVIDVDIRQSTPDWEPYVQPVAPAGAPNVLYVVLDDVGYSAMEPWGGLIETPNINRLAETGLTYTNWHTTALCSPTRSSLLTGRNHTTNGMACIAEATTGFPNANGHIPFGTHGAAACVCSSTSRSAEVKHVHGKRLKPAGVGQSMNGARSSVLSTAWRHDARGKAIGWWIETLRTPATRAARPRLPRG